MDACLSARTGGISIALGSSVEILAAGRSEWTMCMATGTWVCTCAPLEAFAEAAD